MKGTICRCNLTAVRTTDDMRLTDIPIEAFMNEWSGQIIPATQDRFTIGLQTCM